jgi:hypothetical protein
VCCTTFDKGGTWSQKKVTSYQNPDVTHEKVSLDAPKAQGIPQSEPQIGHHNGGNKSHKFGTNGLPKSVAGTNDKKWLVDPAPLIAQV